jgi:hypothetical protein
MSTTYQTVTVTDSAGNSYLDAVSQAHTADGHQIHIFYAANVRGGANIVHATFSGTNNHPWLAIYEYSGLITTNPLDQVAHAQGSDGSPFTGLITTRHSDELAFAATGMPASYTGVVSDGYGYTLLAQDTGTSRAATEVAALNSTGQYAGRLNLSAPTNWTAAVATFIVAPDRNPPPSITTTSLRNAVQGQTFGDILTGTNGKLPFTWSIVSGRLPAGLMLNPSSGVISGTASSTGTSNFTVQLSDGNSQSDSRSLSITVNPNAPPPAVTTTSLPSGTQGQPYSAQLQASGGLAPYSWAVSTDFNTYVGELPPGLTLNPKTGVISGTPTGGGSSFYVTVTDADYHIAISNQLTITINPSHSIARIQRNGAEGNGVSSLSVPFAAATTAGNMIIAFVRMSTTYQTVTVTDSAGNSYADAVSQAHNADGSQVHIFYAPRIRGGSDTVTVTFSGINNHPFVAIYEYSGVTTLDSTAHAQGSDTHPNSGTTAQASSPNELIFGGLGLPSSSGVTVTAGPAGWTLELQDTNQFGSRAATEDGIINNLPGPFDATFSLSGAANWASIVASFKP